MLELFLDILLDWRPIRVSRQWAVRIEAMWRGLPGFRKTIFSGLFKILEALGGLCLSWLSIAAIAYDNNILAYFNGVGFVGWVGMAISLHGAISATIEFIRAFTDVQAYKSYGDGIDIVARPEKSTIRFGHKIAFAKLDPSSEEKRGGFTIDTNALFRTDTFMRSPTFDDAAMAQSSWPFRTVASRQWKLFDNRHAEGRRQIEFLIPRLLGVNLPTVNETKCGFNLPDSGTFADISSYKVNYIDSLITNEAFRSGLFLVRGTQEISPRNNLTLNYPAAEDENGRAYLLPLNACPDIGNHVGITVLAITREGHVVALRQGSVQIGAKTLNLGGSGSLNASDRYDCGAPDDFRAIVGYAMARELYEEAGLKPWHFGAITKRTALRRLASDLLVTGYFRWVDRCGKPEFVGAIRLNLPMSKVAAKTREVRRFDTELPRIHQPGDFAVLKAALCDLAEATQLRVSTSSVVALDRLIEIASYRDSDMPARQNLYAGLTEKLFSI